MRQPLSPRQRVVVAIAVCAAVVLTPLGVGVASTSLVSIVDPSVSTHKARVTANGAIQSSTWAGVPNGYFNAQAQQFGDGPMALLSVPEGKRLAITQITVSFRGTGVGDEVAIWNLIIPSTDSCGSPPAGKLTVMRVVDVPAINTIQLNWNGPALFTPPPGASKQACLIANVMYAATDQTSVGITGYTY
jgi:hypothetical protein